MENYHLIITGASGSIYAKLMIEKLLIIKSQWKEIIAVVMTGMRKKYGKRRSVRDLMINMMYPIIV